MRMEITGQLNPEYFEDAADNTLQLWLKKINKDNPDMATAMEGVEELQITAMTVDFAFKLKDSDEWQVITTDNHAEIPELLIVKAEVDERGHVIADTVTDNDGDSDYSDIEALIAAGLHKQELKPADSIYTAGELTEVAGYYIGDYRISISTDTEGQVVVHAEELNWQGDSRLVAETVFPADQLATIKQHYLELAEATAE